MPNAEVALLQNCLVTGAIVFAIGLLGFLARRNLIVMFLSAEMMLQGVSISLVAWGRYHNDWGGQLLVVFIITVAACEAAIALALVLMLFRRGGNLDAAIWNQSREDNMPEFKDMEIPADHEDESHFPRLTPAGNQPQIDKESQLYRPRV